MRPMMFFGLISLFLAALSLFLGVPVILEYLDTGLVSRQPTAILASAIGTLATLLFVAGLVLNGVARSYREARHLCYLNVRR